MHRVSMPDLTISPQGRPRCSGVIPLRRYTAADSLCAFIRRSDRVSHYGLHAVGFGASLGLRVGLTSRPGASWLARLFLMLHTKYILTKLTSTGLGIAMGFRTVDGDSF